MESRNRINLFLIFYLSIVIIHSIWQTAEILDIYRNLTYGANLTIFNIFYLIMLLIPLEFINFLKNWKMLYSLPITACFFIGYGLILHEDIFILSLMSMIASIFTSLILIMDGQRNKNGLPLALGVFVFLIGLEFIPGFLFPGIIIKFFAGIILLFGSLGYFDKYLYVDIETEEKIKNTWIAKIVDVKK